jgi:hypothetical protein
VALAFCVAAAFPATARASEAPTFADREGPSDEGRDRSFALLVAPLAMAFGAFGAESDFVATASLVVAIDAGAVRTPSWAQGANGASGGAGLIAYPSGSAFHAFYVAGRLGAVRSMHEAVFQVDRRTDVADVGISAGWQWTWDYGLSVRVGGGPLAAVGAAPPSMSPALLVGPLRFSLSADVSVGWAF